MNNEALSQTEHNKTFGRDGRPISVDVARNIFSKTAKENRRVAATDVGDIHISTVWLVYDHGGGDGPPMIFETMVFRAPDGDDRLRRYSTEAEAVIGHAEVVQEIESLLAKP